MSKIVWTSDIHLNFLSKIADRKAFYEDIRNRNPDCVVISGDIAESHNVVKLLQEMQTSLQIPVYFVLGNHDFYRSNVKDVKASVAHLGYLPNLGVLPLSESTALVGVDSWGDCRNGDYENSKLTMSDWLYITELNKAYLTGRTALKTALQKLADRDARVLKKNVLTALKTGFKRIIIITHVPPFENASYNAGRKSGNDGLPFFSSQILGTMIKPIAEQNPNIDFLWLCGHTHSKVSLQVLQNLEIRVAQSEYYYPTVAGVLDYE